MQPELVGFERVPGQIQPSRSLGLRPDAVLPAVVGDEVAAGVAHDGWPDLARQLEYVFPKAEVTGARMLRFVQAGVHATSHVLHKGAEQAPWHRTDQVRGVENERGGGHDLHSDCRQPLIPVSATPWTR